MAGWTFANAQEAPKNRIREPAAAPPAKAADKGLEIPRKADRTSLGLGQISIIDKFMAAELTLGPGLRRTTGDQWAEEYKALYGQFSRDANPNSLAPSRAVLALALGIKASDGVLALKAHDKEALNSCAEQIEKLAVKLDVPGKNLHRASIIKHHALAARWVEAFMELGFLQREVSRTLEANDERKHEALLIIVGSWLQGGRCITSLIAKNHTTESSNILREPRLIEILAAQMKAMPESSKSDPVVQEIFKFLPEIQKDVDVERNAPVPLETVKKMHESFTVLTDLVLKPAAPKP